MTKKVFIEIGKDGIPLVQRKQKGVELVIHYFNGEELQEAFLPKDWDIGYGRHE
jgi:hypothetical protein